MAYRDTARILNMSRALITSTNWRLSCLLAGAVAAIGCGGGQAPVLTADPTGTILFEQGQDALVEGEWGDAITAFDTLLKNYPSSPYLAEARLGSGRAYYEQGRVETLIMAIDSFQSFLTYHPSHEHVDYAQYMVGMTYRKQMKTPDRDQAPTRQAIATFDTFIDAYPSSPLYEAAVAERLAGIDTLAAHELQVAKWQAKRDRDWDAAVDRVNWALEQFPETTLKCPLIFTLAQAHKKGEQLEDAVRYYEQVINEYPDCEHVEDAEKRLRELNGT